MGPVWEGAWGGAGVNGVQARDVNAHFHRDLRNSIRWESVADVSKDVPATLGSDVTQTLRISLHVNLLFYRLTEKYRPVQYTVSILNWIAQLSEDFIQNLRECVITAGSLWMWGQRVTVPIMIYRTVGPETLRALQSRCSYRQGAVETGGNLIPVGHTKRTPCYSAFLIVLNIHLLQTQMHLCKACHTTDVAMQSRKIFFLESF